MKPWILFLFLLSYKKYAASILYLSVCFSVEIFEFTVPK